MNIIILREIKYRTIEPIKIVVGQLKKFTYYSYCGENNEFIERFWRVFEGFT